MPLENKLKLARERLQKTQRIMAEIVGVSKRAWPTSAEGKSVPRGKIFAALADFGFNVNWFFTNDPAVPMLIVDLSKGEGGGEQEFQAGDVTSDITDAINIQELLNMTAEVLVSNTLYRPALSANIKAFHRSIALEQDNKELKNRVEKIEARLLELEKETAEPKPEAQKPDLGKKPAVIVNKGVGLGNKHQTP